MTKMIEFPLPLQSTAIIGFQPAQFFSKAAPDITDSDLLVRAWRLAISDAKTIHKLDGGISRSGSAEVSEVEDEDEGKDGRRHPSPEPLVEMIQYTGQRRPENAILTAHDQLERTPKYTYRTSFGRPNREFEIRIKQKPRCHRWLAPLRSSRQTDRQTDGMVPRTATGWQLGGAVDGRGDPSARGR
ncbi:hypothetical protein C8R45DRAFT_934224 [Mycena sanguinolenta]|nr:hypothetical protein C8R45DRAFT_934224 [Mycena sanguinolenta]